MSKPSNPYRNSSGHPWLRRSVAVFVDILGYREIVRTATETRKHEEVLTSLRGALDNYFEKLNFDEAMWANEPALWRVKTFSDNITIGCPIREGGDGVGEMLVILGRFAAFQLGMTLSGFFLRGGAAIGDLYMDSEIIYGPAIIDAHDTEASSAIDPRIVLHGSAVACLDENARGFDTFLKDVDGLIFVDYLQPIIEFEKECGPDVESLDRHRDMIVSRLNEFSSNPKVWSKYLWSARYHNCFCKAHHLEEHEIELANLIKGPVPLSEA